MNSVIEELERISLIEQLEHEGWEESLIESLMDAANNTLEEAIICKNTDELHAAIETMSSIDEEESR